MITIPIQQPWHVGTPILVGYLDRRYVQDFFDRGVLRPSCFVEFAKHTDEQRLDRNEGVNFLVGRSEDQTVTAWTKHGTRSYVLCPTQIESPDLQSDFAADSGFRIMDSTNFGLAVAVALPGSEKG